MWIEFVRITYEITLPIVLGLMVHFLKEQKSDRKANTTGLMLLLRVQLIEYHDKYVKAGEIPTYAYENFCEMYAAYHELGGNGMVTKMFEEVKELHIKTKEA